jgi:N-acetyl-gamma-glutamyl-phosphate reductase
MGKKSIFIDGEAGTTGLRIKSLLGPLLQSGQIELLSINHDLRKDPAERKKFFGSADVSILCLPDEEAVKAMELVGKGRVIDASSAHRTNPDWVFGFPEMSEEQPDLIRKAKRVTNPGCYATGAIAILKPLIDAGIMPADFAPHIDGISGYSGGGNKLVDQYEAIDGGYARDNALRLYALHAPHKHIPEIVKHAGLSANPIYTVATIDAYQGMKVQTAFDPARLGATLEEVHALLTRFYTHEDTHVRVVPIDEVRASNDINFKRFSAFTSQTGDVDDKLDIFVTGWSDMKGSQVTITAVLDNLGKGAAAQAIQNLKLMLDLQ